MQKQLLRRLGKNGPLVNALGFGAMGMSEFYGPSNDEDNLVVLNRTLDLGCNFWDTSDIYGTGHNEELLAKVLKTRRDEVFLCTKFGIVRGENGERLGVDGTPEYVKKACEASLKRLGVDYIDLYYQHRKNPDHPIEDTVRAMAELVKEGKVKYLGLSECSAENIRRAHAIHPISAYQVEFSLWTLDIETDGRLQACRDLGIAVVAYSPLGRGMLTGNIKTLDDVNSADFRKNNPRFQGENFQKNLQLVNAIEKMAQEKNIPVGQLALAWVLDQGEDVFAIPGTKRIGYLEENVGALDVKLTEEDHKTIRGIIDTFKIAGDRYPFMSRVNN